MNSNVNNQEIEKLIIKQFNYMEELKNEKRSIRAQIRNKQSKLNEEQKMQNEFNEMAVSLNIGKGKYYIISSIPYDLKDYMSTQSFKDLKDDEKEKVIENYNLAVMRARQQSERFEFLLKDSKSRKDRIKNLKKDILLNKKELCKIEKTYSSYFLSIKKLDKQLKTDKNENVMIYKEEDNK